MERSLVRGRKRQKKPGVAACATILNQMSKKEICKSGSSQEGGCNKESGVCDRNAEDQLEFKNQAFTAEHVHLRKLKWSTMTQQAWIEIKSRLATGCQHVFAVSELHEVQ